jgi:uncharacterized membrane protein YkvA (DUF1232 family)
MNWKRVALFPVHLARLAGGLLADERVPTSRKVAVGAGVLYVFSPVDLLPEALLPGVGWLDDGVVLLRVLRALLCDVELSVARDHWRGEEEDLVRLRDALSHLDDVTAEAVRVVRDAVLGRDRVRDVVRSA